MQDKFVYDEDAANLAVDFIETFCRHGKGKYAGQRLILADWQRDLVRTIFGWKRPDGTRRYRQVYLEVGRGNGKSTLASAIALYMLYSDGEKGPTVVSCASTRPQAAIVFDAARRMVEQEPKLIERSETYRRSIVVPESNGSYHVISSDAPAAHGLNLSAAIFDEVHTQPNRDLWDAVTTSMVKRAEPLLFAITTAGPYDPESLCWQLHEYAIQVRDGLIKDDSFLPVIYAADEEDDISDRATWLKANPNLGISVSEEYLEQESAKAKRLPRYTNAFKRLHLNIWTNSVTRWIAPEQWNACEAPFPDLTGRVAYAGLDLSTTTDLSAFVLLFPPVGNEPYYVLPHFFIPASKIADKRDRVPYDAWVRNGLVTATPGNVIDYDYIRAEVNRLAEQYKILDIGFDPFNATQLATQLAEQDGFDLTIVRQGFLSMNAPSKEFERLVMSGRIAHDGNAVLRWMINNIAVKTDVAGNIKPDKSKSTERIDGVVAAIIALSRAMTDSMPGSVYDTRGLMYI